MEQLKKCFIYKAGDKVIYQKQNRTIYNVYGKNKISLCLIDSDGYEYEDVEEDYLTDVKELEKIKLKN